jgi:DNA end-binding protein Ku
VAKAKESRGEGGGGEATVHEMPKPKQTAAKKTPASRADARLEKAQWQGRCFPCDDPG